MGRHCKVCLKSAIQGKKIARRGIAKRSGGIGLKITGITIRRFEPNLQTVRAVWEGGIRRIRVCTKCIKAGKITKAPVRPVFSKTA